MKKVYFTWLMVMLVLTFTACGEQKSEEYASEPPKLTILYEETEGEATRFSYSWDDGKEAVEACGQHVLDAVDSMLQIDLKESNCITLKFEEKPDYLSVCYWDASFAGKAEQYYYNFVQIEDVEDTFTVPEDGNYIFEIHAFWEDLSGANGDAYYGFYAKNEAVETGSIPEEFPLVGYWKQESSDDLIRYKHYKEDGTAELIVKDKDKTRVIDWFVEYNPENMSYIESQNAESFTEDERMWILKVTKDYFLIADSEHDGEIRYEAITKEEYENAK